MFNKLSTSALRVPLCAVPLIFSWSLAMLPAHAQGAAVPAPGQTQTQDQSFSKAQVQQMVAPIALYPDPLLSQILMASTYPLEVVEAARWSQNNPSVTGASLEAAMQQQSWDPSVKALAAVPQTLQMMSDKLDWIQQLGDAFLAQQQDVLDAVQTLRAEAQAAGNLQSTPQQTVTTAQPPAGQIDAGVQPPIVIQPVNPDVYYVPVYNPGVVYGAWDYPAYQPFYWSPPGFVASNIVSFAAGVAVGAAIWGNCDWWHHNVIINVNRYNVFNRTNITNNIWVHNPAHRGGVPYRNAAVAERFGRGNDVAARDAFRERADADRGNVFGDRGDQANRDAEGRAAGLRDDAMRGRVDDQRLDMPRRAPENTGETVGRRVPDADIRRDEDRPMQRIEEGGFRRDFGSAMEEPRRFDAERRMDDAFRPHMDFRRR